MTVKQGNFHVQAFFLHDRMLAQYLSAGSAARITQMTSEPSKNLNKVDFGYSLQEHHVAEIFAAKPPELSLWLLEGRADGDSALVTTTQAFYFRKENESRRSFSNKLAADRAVTVNGTFSISRCVGDTGRDLLQGHRRVTVLAHADLTEDGGEPVVELTPLFMGVLVERDVQDDSTFLFEDRREVYPSQLSEFAKLIDHPRPSKHALKAVSTMPEAKIKECFAEILGQDFVDNDWGGETSDLSCVVTVDGISKSAAFALKGPAVKGKFTVGKMGKNGDQGMRLFHESIDLAVVQYHGSIAAEVRNLMSDIARSRNKRFMILNGTQTAAILEAYGFISTTQPAPGDESVSASPASGA